MTRTRNNSNETAKTWTILRKDRVLGTQPATLTADEAVTEYRKSVSHGAAPWDKDYEIDLVDYVDLKIVVRYRSDA